MKETFILFTEYAKHIALLNMEQRGVLFTAIMSYEAEEELPEMDSITQMAFSFIKEDLDRNGSSYQKKVEANRENGKKGGRPKQEEKPNDFEEKPKKPKKPNGYFEKPKKPNGYFENPGECDCDSDRDTSTPNGVSVPRVGAREDGTDEGIGEVETGEISEETDETVAGYLTFMREHPTITDDTMNPNMLCGVDFALLAQKIAESKRVLQGKKSLKWLLRHYSEIIGDSFKDYPSRVGEPPTYGKGDLQLWRELVNALSTAKEPRWSESAQTEVELFRMVDDETKREMGELYKALSREITEYFEPNSFLELCTMSDEELKYERARFLKALPGIRRKLSRGE